MQHPTELPDDHAVPLESVLRTEELFRRPSRPPDYQAENRTLTMLAKALADSPHTILQTLADTTLEAIRANSAGLSLLTPHDDGRHFYWPAIAGAWKPHIGSGTPRDFGPCGDVLDRGTPLLFNHFERRYPYLRTATPAVNEALLVPFYVKGKAVGTIWVMAHDERRRFDAEDLRQLESLGQFASAAYQAVNLRQAEDSHRARHNLMEDAVDARQALEKLNVELRESERRFRQMIDALPVAVYTTDAEGRLTHFNPAAVEFAGRTPVLGTDEWCPSWKLFNADGTPLPHDRCPMAISMKEGREIRGVEVIAERPDGTRVWGTPYPTPLRNSAGAIEGGINMVVDITERKAAEERKNMLMAELDHRVKNTLMVVSSLISQTGKSVDSPQEFATVMNGRVQALGRAHGLLNQHQQVHAKLRDIVVGELDAYRSAGQENIPFGGPEAVYLTPKATQILAMALHELATNAAKYGALSAPSGKVAVNWCVTNWAQDPRLLIEWIESDGPRVKTPARRGFGSQLIEHVVSYELQANVQRDFQSDGVRCTIEFSLTDKTGYALAQAEHRR